MSEAPRRRRRAAVTALGLMLMGCSTPPPDRPTGEPLGRPSSPPPQRAVTVQPVGYVGVVIAPQAVDLAAEVAGTLGELDVALGDRVTEGTELARVQTPTLPAEIEAAEAAIARAEAARAEQHLLVVAARTELKREQRLASAGVTSSQDLERAQLKLARFTAAVRRLEAQREERRAELRRLHAQREAGRVLAPFSGTVAAWYQPAGAVVSPGDRVVRLIEPERLWVRFAVPVDDLDQVRPGVDVEVIPVPDAPRLLATIRHVAPELELASQRMLVEAELHRAHAVKAGQACHVVLDAESPAEPGHPPAIVISSTDRATPRPGGT